MASNASVATKARTLLVGDRPKPVSSGQHGPKCQRRFLFLVFIISTLLFMLSARLGVAQQSINVRLDRDDLLHIPSRLLIFSIELFFLCCELAAFFLQHIHFRELRPAQQRAHFRLCSPVQFKVGLMLRKEFPAVLRRLILLKDWAGFGILNRCGLLKDRP